MVVALVYSREAYNASLLTNWADLKTYSTCMLLYLIFSFICKMVVYLVALGFVLNVRDEHAHDPEQLSQARFNHLAMNMVISLSFAAYCVYLAYSLKKAVQYLIVQKDVYESKQVVIVDNQKDGNRGEQNQNTQSANSTQQGVELPNVSFEANEENKGLKDFV